MHVDDVRQRVEKIRSDYSAGEDIELAHSKEDKLHQDVLKAIADGRCKDPAACAEAALETQNIDFTRYYA